MPASKTRPDGSSAPAPDWRTLHLWQIQPVRDVLVLLLVVGLLWLGRALSLVTVPILLAMGLAYLFEPLVKRVTRRRWVSRPGAALAIIAIVGLAVVVPATLGLGFAAVQGVAVARAIAATTDDFRKVFRFSQEAVADGPGGQAVVLPDEAAQGGMATVEFRRSTEAGESPDLDVRAAYDRLPRPVRWAAYRLLRQDAAQLEEPDSVDPAARQPSTADAALDAALGWIQANAGAIGQRVVGGGVSAVEAALRTLASIGFLAFTGLLTAFFFYFFCTGWGRVLAFWESLIPERRKGRAFDLLRQMDAVVAGFIRGRLTICMVLCVFLTIGYWLIGAPAPLLLGPLVGVLSIVPYVGLVGIPITIVMMLIQPSPVAWQQAWWWVLLAPIGVYQLAQILDDYILSPRIQGKATGMDTPVILFASLAGGALAGFYGLLLAIPVAACLKILLREVFWPRFRAWAEGKERDLLPISRE